MTTGKEEIKKWLSHASPEELVRLIEHMIFKSPEAHILAAVHVEEKTTGTIEPG
jgi:hypothetical protein